MRRLSIDQKGGMSVGAFKLVNVDVSSGMEIYCSRDNTKAESKTAMTAP